MPDLQEKAVKTHLLLILLGEFTESFIVRILCRFNTRGLQVVFSKKDSGANSQPLPFALIV